MTPAASAPPTPAASAPPTPAAARAPLSATLSAPAREAVATAPPTGTTASAATPTAPALASASTGSAARAVDTTAAAASDVSAGPLEPAAPGLLDGGVTGARAGSGGGEARADYFDELFARVLGALDYPRRARLDGSEGVVVVRLTIDRQGRLEACAVADGSGAPVLDRHACRIARRAAPFGPVPPSFGPGDLSFELPVEFALTR